MKAKLRFLRTIVHSVLTGSLFAAVLLHPLSAPHAAEPVGWEDLRFYGGQIYDIAIDPVDPNIIFAGSYYGDGLFKTTNGGETWQAVDGFRNEVVYSISLDPREHRTIWVTTYLYIYKSEDGGQTWIRFDPGDQDGYTYYFSVEIDPEDSNTVYVGTAGYYSSNDDARMYKTVDGGQTWQMTSLVADHNVFDLAINPQDHQEVWAVTGPQNVTEGSIYRSQDGGETWAKVNTALAPGHFHVVAIDPWEPNNVFVGGKNGIYRTEDGGVTWSQLEPSSSCHDIVIDPQRRNTVHACWSGYFSKSTDGGDSWGTYHISPFHLLCFVICPQNNDIIFGGDFRKGVCRSTNGGQSWSSMNEGIRANHVFASSSSPSGKLLLGSVAGVFLKNTGGNWEELIDHMAHAVVFDPTAEATIYAGFDWTLGKSTDSGQNWTLYQVPPSESGQNYVSSVAINPQNPETLYLGVFYRSGDKGEIYKSTDGGQSGRLLKSLDAPVNVVVLNPQNPRIIYACSGHMYGPIGLGGIYKSIDGGETWERMASGAVFNALAVDPGDPDIIYAGCGASNGLYAGLFKSIDGGRTWQKKDYGIYEYATIINVGIDPHNRNTIFAATLKHGIYISYNGGEYWTLFGLSDYWLLDLLVTSSSPASSKARRISGSEWIPSSDVYAGSQSGFLEFTGSGIGAIAGLVNDAKTGLGITGATLSTDTGGTALALSGNYIMVVPAGICQVNAKAEGCLGASQRNVSVTAREETEVDFSLVPFPSAISIKEFETSATGPVSVGTPVTFTAEAEASGSTTLYFRFYVASEYGTPNYGNWQMIQDYSTANSCTWTPQAEGSYVVVAWVTDDPTSGKFHQVGIAVSTTQTGASPVQITKFESDISHPLSVGTQVTFTAVANGGSGTIQYQFWVTDGTNWQSTPGYSTIRTCTWTPREAGCYIIVVWASDTEATQSPPIAGWTCMVE